jgi:hypothetical protein
MFKPMAMTFSFALVEPWYFVSYVPVVSSLFWNLKENLIRFLVD